MCACDCVWCDTGDEFETLPVLLASPGEFCNETDAGKEGVEVDVEVDWGIACWSGCDVDVEEGPLTVVVAAAAS